MNTATTTASTSAFGSLLNIFLEPRKTMEAIRPHTSWLWLPLILLVVVSVIFQVWYLKTVDFNWFVDQTLAPSAANMTADQLRAAHDRMTPGTVLGFGVVFGTVGLVVWYLIQALYFFLAAKIGGLQQQGFGTWLNFISWTSMPALLGYIATGVYLLTASSKQISPVDIDITSLNTLALHIPYAAHGQALAQSLRITTIWSWVLMTIGFSAWTGKSMGQSAIAVLAPYAICYVIWIVWNLI